MERSTPGSNYSKNRKKKLKPKEKETPSHGPSSHSKVYEGGSNEKEKARSFKKRNARNDRGDELPQNKYHRTP